MADSKLMKQIFGTKKGEKKGDCFETATTSFAWRLPFDHQICPPFLDPFPQVDLVRGESANGEQFTPIIQPGFYSTQDAPTEAGVKHDAFADSCVLYTTTCRVIYYIL